MIIARHLHKTPWTPAALLVHLAFASTGLTLSPSAAAFQAQTTQPVSDKQPADAGDAEIPAITLKYQGTIKLESNLPPEPPIRNVLDFDIDDRGRFGFIRLSGDCPFVLVSPAGEVLAEIGLKEVFEATILPSLRWAGGDRWVIADTPGHTGVAWWIDVASKRVAPIKDFACPEIKAITGDRHGGFVVLGYVELERRGKFVYRSRMELIGFDSEGRRQWCLPENGEDIQLPSTAGIGVLSNGDVAILDTSGNHWTPLGLQVFDPAEKSARKIDLKGDWCRRGGELAIDPSNQFIVTRPYGTPPSIQRLEADGSEEPEIKPAFSDGRVFTGRGGVRIDADGRLWACDGESFFRLDEKGIVDLTLGEEPSDKILREVGGRKIDQQGRAYLTNERTGFVHVFDTDGKRIHVLKHDPQEFERLGLEGSTHRCLRLPDGSGSWDCRYKNPRLFDSDGKFRYAITERPDGQRLRWVESVAFSPDGKLAVICNDLDRPSTNDDYTLNLYTQHGDPIRTVPIPIDGRISLPTFDGRFVAFGTWGGDLFVLDGESGDCRRIVPPPRDRDQEEWLGGWYPFFTKQGKELWLLHITTRTIERYAWEPQHIEAEQRAPTAP